MPMPYQPQMYPLPPMYQPPPPHMYPPPPMYQPPLPHMYPPVPPQLFENQGENVTFFEYIFGQRPQSQRSSQDTSQAEGEGEGGSEAYDLPRYSTNCPRIGFCSLSSARQFILMPDPFVALKTFQSGDVRINKSPLKYHEFPSRKLQCACGQDFSTSHTNALHSYSMDLQKTIDSGKKIAGLLQFNGTKGKKMEIQLNNNILFRKTFVEFNMTK
ncbi:hypothetical protein V6N12_068673 [Hibiscus sabdariffa]|uniref:Uncharacterized protein n=1 Tax=Hibiscus sabdariffa TaxID=183260 RepID=A0ABR2FQY5_9ROSI